MIRDFCFFLLRKKLKGIETGDGYGGKKVGGGNEREIINTEGTEGAEDTEGLFFIEDSAAALINKVAFV